MKPLVGLIATTSLLFGLPALGQVDSTPPTDRSLNQPDGAVHSPPGNEISEASASSAQRPANLTFKALFSVLEASGLAATLSGPGPFTVFAPTDQAFAALPTGTLEELLKPEHKETLVKLLNYHVIFGAVPSGDLKSGAMPTTAGSAVQVQVNGAKQVGIDSAKIILPDVPANNGLIHVIDRVILPPDILSQPSSSPD